MMLREVLAGGRHLDQDIIAYPLGVADVVRRIAERGVREGSFRPVDPLLTHLSLGGSLLIVFATAPETACVKRTQDLVVHGLAAEPANVGAEPNGEYRRGGTR
jgi:hypothetical protein